MYFLVVTSDFVPLIVTEKLCHIGISHTVYDDYYYYYYCNGLTHVYTSCIHMVLMLATIGDTAQ